MSIFIIILLIIIAIGFGIYKFSKWDKQKEGEVKYIGDQQRTISANRAIIADLEKQRAILQSQIADTNKKIAERQSDFDRIVQSNSTYTDNLYENQRKIVDEKIANYSRQVFDELNEKYEHQRLLLEAELVELIDRYDTETFAADAALVLIHDEIDQWTAKQTAINEEALRREQLEKEHEKYHIQLSDDDKADIAYLLDLAKKLNKKTTLSKFVWSEYVLPAFNAMLKLQFGAKKPKSVIYMISIGDKKYIGKTKQDIGTRWTSHLKSALGIEGAVTQDIHKALINNLDTASFQVLEADIPDDELGDREKFYITQYQTDKYGFNMKAGG